MRRLLFLLGALGALFGIVPISAPAAQAATPPALPPAPRFWLVEPNGHVWNFGGAAPKGTLAGTGLTQPLVATATTSDGFYALGSDGGVFTFGDAKYFGSTGALRLNRPIVGLAQTPSKRGYWLVASDGGVFSFGDARFFGSTGSIRLNQPIVGMTPTPTGKGYWLVASDGGVFSFGDAKFFGSTGAIRLKQPITSITPARDGKGYWLLARDGGVFTFGSARFLGSAASSSSQSAQRLLVTGTGNGYWIMRENGELASFGDARYADPGTQAVLWTPSTPGDRAVQFAFAQLGKPYIWGGNGPVGYDCSGLTLAAWRSVGRSFARVANDQYRSVGVPVAMTALEPGDLVFWGDDLDDWRSVYHTAMYVGGGQIVQSTGDHVQLSRLRQWGTGDIMPVGRRP
jgi:hypothetical protein